MADDSRKTYGSTTASGYARLHLGDMRNSFSYNYNIRKRRSDETLREDDRNEVFLAAAAEGQTPRVQHLLHLGADVDHSDALGLTALHHACLSGYDDTVQVLLDAGADVNANSLNCGTPLHLAVLKVRNSVVQLLLRYRAGADKPSRLLGAPMHCAYYAGSAEIIQLLESVNANEVQYAAVLPNLMKSISLEADLVPRPSTLPPLQWQYDYWSNPPRLLGNLALCCLPFHLAFASGHLSTLDRLPTLEATWYGATVSHLNEESLAELRESVGCMDNIILATLFDQPRLLERHLQKFPSTDAQGRSKAFARKIAIEYGHSQCLEVLLSHSDGTDWRSRGYAEISFAASNVHHVGGKGRLQALLSHYSLCNIEKQKVLSNVVCRADTHALDHLLDLWGLENVSHITLALVAASLTHNEILRKLVDHGLDINYPKSALLQAAHENQRTEVARNLLKHGALVDSQDGNGNTALHIAAKEHRVQLMCLLIDSGTSTDLRNEDGNTALLLALLHTPSIDAECLPATGGKPCVRNQGPDRDVQTSRKEIISLLLEHGASAAIRNNEGCDALEACFKVEKKYKHDGCLRLLLDALRGIDRKLRTPRHVELDLLMHLEAGGFC